MSPVPFDGARLGAELARLRDAPPSAKVIGRIMVTPKEAKRFLRFGLTAFGWVALLFLRYATRFRARRAFGRDTYLTQGNALVARLRASLLDREVPLWLDTALLDLVVENGRVTGVVVAREGRSVRIAAKRGVLLGSGGFERNGALREVHGHPQDAVVSTVGAESNTGDALALGARVGAKTALLEEAWWTPVTRLPGARSGWVLIVEKSLPGGIFVDRDGRRFTNEAAPYEDVVRAMRAHHAQTGRGVPATMIFDARYRRHYIAGPVAPSMAMPDGALPRKLRERFLVKAATLAELAQKLDMDPSTLEQTVMRFNAMARRGVDDDHGRGASASDRYYGDPRVGANPCLAPLERAPFYAIPVFPGDLGTKGGLVIDGHARVRRVDGAIVPGLFAAGNASAAVLGRAYPGAGGTLGPALTFGFVAAETAMASAHVRDEPLPASRP